MRYVISKYQSYKEEMIYRFYITDSLYFTNQNQMISKRYSDLLKTKKIDNRTGDEIALDVIEKAGLKVKGN